MMNEKIQMGKANIGVIEVKRIKKRVGGRIYLVNYGKVNHLKLEKKTINKTYYF